MAKHTTESRRSFLRFAAGAAAFAGPASLPWLSGLAGIGAASAQTSASDYRALVCVYLGGGVDHLSTVPPYDSTNHTAYRQARQNLALSRADLLPLGSQQSGAELAMAPALSPLKSLYDAGRLAVVSNVGPLYMPVTKSNLRAQGTRLPPSIGSHVDQFSQWQAFAPEGVRYGWGGRIGDMVASMNGKPYLTLVSTDGFSVVLSARNLSQFAMSPEVYLEPLSVIGDIDKGYGTYFGGQMDKSTVRMLVANSSDRSNLLEKEYTRRIEQLLQAEADVASVAQKHPKSSFASAPANNHLATQLLGVARMIAGAKSLGQKRQVFSVVIQGFDLHANAAKRHPEMLTEVANALSYFDSLMRGLNLSQNVTLFTMSEFGRSLSANGDGTDHGWGGHHFVMGGAVRGKAVYGSIPAIGYDNANHDQHLMIPTTSVDQYGATLARWMGVSDSSLGDIFPNLSRFDTRDLGFMTA